MWYVAMPFYAPFSFAEVYHHHHHIPKGLGVFPVPWSSRWSWPLHLFLGRPMFLHPFVLYCSACFGSLFVSTLCTCCSHFFWYCFISFAMFCAPVFCLIHWFFSLSICWSYTSNSRGVASNGRLGVGRPWRLLYWHISEFLWTSLEIFHITW